MRTRQHFLFKNILSVSANVTLAKSLTNIRSLQHPDTYQLFYERLATGNFLVGISFYDRLTKLVFDLFLPYLLVLSW